MLRLACLLISLFGAMSLYASECTGAAGKAGCAEVATAPAVAAGTAPDDDGPVEAAPAPPPAPGRTVNGPRVDGSRWQRLLPGMFR